MLPKDVPDQTRRDTPEQRACQESASQRDLPNQASKPPDHDVPNATEPKREPICQEPATTLDCRSTSGSFPASQSSTTPPRSASPVDLQSSSEEGSPSSTVANAGSPPQEVNSESLGELDRENDSNCGKTSESNYSSSVEDLPFTGSHLS